MLAISSSLPPSPSPRFLAYSLNAVAVGSATHSQKCLLVGGNTESLGPSRPELELSRPGGMVAGGVHEWTIKRAHPTQYFSPSILKRIEVCTSIQVTAGKQINDNEMLIVLLC